MIRKGTLLAVGIGLLLACVAYAVAFQDRKADRAPLLAEQKTKLRWEYKLLALDDLKIDAEKAFNELGRDGWEFVTVYSAPGPVNQFGTRPEHAVFKRSEQK